MKRLSLSILLIITTISAFSQTGNFRTLSGGTWSTATIWERDADQNGTYEESPSSVAPNSLSNLIEIQNTHSVILTTNETINGTLTIQSGGSLTISAAGPPSDRLTISASGILNNQGILTMAGGLIKRMRVFGRVNNQSTMTGFTTAKLFFESNSIYDHQHTTTAGTIPLGTWDTSSTCMVSGYTSNSVAPTNLGQSFGNFTWDCSSQTSAIDLSGGLVTVNGNLNLLNTGFTGVFLNQSGSNTTVTVAGDLNVEEYFLISESGSNNVLDIQGNAILTSNFPYLVLSGASGNATLNVGGSVTLDNSGFIDMSQAGSGSSEVNISGDLSMSNFSYITTGFGSGSYTINFNGNSEQVITASTNELFDGQNINIMSNAIVSVPNNNFLGTSGALNVANLAELRVGSNAANGAIQSSGSAGGIRVTGGQTYATGCTIVYNGATAQFIGSGHPSTSGVNTEINNSNGVTLASSVVLGGELNLTSGNLTVGSNTLTIQGAHSGSGSLAVASTSTLVFSGSGVIGTIPFVSATPTLGTLTIDRSGEVAVFEDDVTIGTALNLTQGNLDIRDQTLNLTGTISGTGNLLANTASTVNITGTGAVGALQFDPTFNTIGNITYNRSSGTLALNGTLNVSQSLVLTNGSLTNNANLFMGNDATLTKNSNATFTGDSPETSGGALYNVIYTNAGQTTGSEIPDALITDALGDITINTSGPLVLDQDLQVNGNVTLDGGSLSIGANSITVLGNWVRNGGSMASYSGQVIFNGTSLINGSSTATFVNVQVPSGASLTLPSGNININGNLQIDPSATFSANGGTVTLGTTANQNIAAGGASFNNIAVTKVSGTVTIAGALNLTGRLSFDGASGATIASGGNLTIVSTSDGATGNGSIGVVPSGANITGNVVVQRFLSGEGRIYRYLSSPVSGANLEQWRDDFPITGTFDDPSTGTGINSTNPSLYRYIESLPGLADDGYEAYPASGALASSTIEVGRGYAAFIREGASSTVIDVTGTVNLANNADIDLNVTYNDDGNGPANEGWNLVGNPFASSIDWDNVLSGTGGTRVNVNQGIQVRDNGAGGTYRVWDGSTGDLNAGVIGTGQAFWVQTTANGPSLTLNELAKTSSTGTFFREEKSDPIEVLQISLSDGVDTDNTFVKIIEGATLGYDLGDTPNLNNVIFDVTTIAGDGVNLAINAIDYAGCSLSLPINVADVSSGEYTLSFSQMESILSAESLSLVDNYTSTIVDVLSNPSYVFEVDENNSATFGLTRFELRLERDFISQEVVLEAASEICQDVDAAIVVKNTQSGITYNLNINGENSAYSVLGNGGDVDLVVLTSDLISGNNELSVSASFEGCENVIINDVLQIEKSDINLNIDYTATQTVCGQESAFVTIDTAQENVQYQLFLNDVAYGDPILGNGLKVSFEVITNDLLEDNNISIQASRNNCVEFLEQTKTVSKTVLNDGLNLESPATVCQGESFNVVLFDSENGVGYQLKINGKEHGEVKTGNGSTLNFDLFSNDLANSNMISIAASNGNCEVNLVNQLSVDIITVDELVSYDVEDICGDGNGAVVISIPQIGVEYAVFLNGEEYGDPVVGAGQPLEFSLLSTDLQNDNTITILATLEGCSANLVQSGTFKKTSIAPQITREDNLLRSNYEEGNSWFLNGEHLTGQTGSTLEIFTSGLYELKVDVNGCSETVGEEFSVDEVTSIDRELDGKNIQLFPNPTNDILNITSSNGTIEWVEFYDARGKLKMKIISGEKTLKINIDNFVNGVYMIRLQSENELSTHRFIKQ
ncbi:MAG: T9SS type A sorting domain-containing protein [Fulvivirga sp.]